MDYINLATRLWKVNPNVLVNVLYIFDVNRAENAGRIVEKFRDAEIRLQTRQSAIIAICRRDK